MPIAGNVQRHAGNVLLPVVLNGKQYDQLFYEVSGFLMQN
jgi:hypothetical protein